MRAASKLEDVAEELTKHPLNRRGVELVGLCPLHDDHTPSLRVNVDRQVWFCDACGTGGDVFTLVARAYELSFPGALAFLADRANMARPHAGHERNGR